VTAALVTVAPIDLVPIRFGEILVIDHGSGVEQPYFVLHRCGHASVGFHCRSCRAALANRGQLEMHAEDGGRHEIAVMCPTHAYMEPTRADLVDVGSGIGGAR
jgi:hypothetical protein